MSEARADRVIALLTRYHPFKTAESVAADTGIRAGTVRQWMARESAPNFAAFCKLIGAYGPEILVAALESPPKWLDDAARAEQLAQADRAVADALAARERLRSAAP